MGITVRRSIGVRVIVTEEFKKELEQELQQAANEAQRRIEQMDVQSRNVLAGFQRMDINQAMQARRQIPAVPLKLRKRRSLLRVSCWMRK